MSETVLQLLDSLHANLLAKVSTDAHAHTWDVHKLHLGMSMACSIKLICMQQLNYGRALSCHVCVFS